MPNTGIGEDALDVVAVRPSGGVTMPRKRPHLRLVRDDAQPPRPPPAPVASYQNRRGVTYYLHAATTKTGRQRYFVRREIGAGAIAALPDGYEFAETVNGLVSVRRAVAPLVPPPDLQLVQAELARHPHLQRHVAESVANAIVVHEPLGMSPDELLRTARQLHMDPVTLARRLERGRPPRYAPVMKFVRRDSERTLPCDGFLYEAHRMTYRGHGGWHCFASGPLPVLVRNVAAIGTDAFFELF